MFFSLETGSQTPAQKLKTLNIALSFACATIEQFQKIEKLDESNANTVQLKQFEMHLQTILRQLIRTSINKQCDATLITTYKRLYSDTLQPTVKRDNFVIFAQHLKKLLENIQKSKVIQS